MAKIMRNEKQENALKQLQEMMDEVMQLNHLLASESYIICDPEDKKLRYPLHSSQKETLTSLLLQRVRVGR